MAKITLKAFGKQADGETTASLFEASFPAGSDLIAWRLRTAMAYWTAPGSAIELITTVAFTDTGQVIADEPVA